MVSDNSLLDNVSEHVSCFVHTLQLVVKDGSKHTAAINKVLAKTAAVVSHVCKSSTLQSRSVVANISKLPVPHVGIPSCPSSGEYSEFRRTSSVLWIHNTSLLGMTGTF